MLKIILPLFVLAVTPALAHESPGSYWLHVYTGHWAHVFGQYQDKATCETAAKAYNRKWVYWTCVPIPPPVKGS